MDYSQLVCMVWYLAALQQHKVGSCNPEICLLNKCRVLSLLWPHREIKTKRIEYKNMTTKYNNCVSQLLVTLQVIIYFLYIYTDGQ